ncbi:MAG TPA: UDP-glucose/GDP-mannose dehydrogenase family protein [Trinickia sp.]|jgi:UDPglucose 6-dehydrogenase|uniref:UDP-glucose dehydrogenase family protein n=1 Tax=Trinickia sp. TaxID=2571163 RepID=UPI002CCF66BE|nr:UDP-glucose/GDP-mannose dehydrogenase family protein [Trinickia sp.]HTI18888.1 UDP-glucose/GDP-mannose dehydrogenase family protein [Trinickia sp.]
MKVTIVGTGYVGLVTGACLAELGNDVFCLDVDQTKIDQLNRGVVPIYEPGLSDIIERNRSAGRLIFSTDVPRAVEHGDIQFIAVGTPPEEDGSADLQYVLAAARSIGAHMTQFKVIVDKSTVPVGTADKVRTVIENELATRGVDAQFAVISNPEFLKEGAAVEDFMRPDRIVIGCDDDVPGLRAKSLIEQLYAPFNRNHQRTFFMDVRSAEFTKYAANAMLATRISFINELANLADRVGADIENVRRGIGSDPRIGYSFLYAGCGYGGSCFPKDVRALMHTAQEHGMELNVLASVEFVNDTQRRVLFEKIEQHFNGDLSGRHFAIWGLAFKPNTDDMRQAASRTLIENLLKAGASVSVYDPVALDEARRCLAQDVGADAFAHIQFCTEPYLALQNADALAIVTEWKEFRSPDFEQMKSALRDMVIFDGRNLYDPATMKNGGWTYNTIGRNAV